MSDPTAPWNPDAPPVAEHFEKAANLPQAQENAAQQETSSATDQGQEAATLQQEEGKLETPEDPGMHYRPDNDELVRDAHEEAKLEAEKQAFFNKMSKGHDDDFGPKM